MSIKVQILIELVKAGFSLLLLIITWGIGQRIIASWDIRKKRQELDIASASQFQQLYGEFKEVGKLWRIYIKNKDVELTFPEHTRWELLKRATSAESEIEAIIVKLATERSLSKSEIKELGLFRQAYQQLREAIRDNKPLGLGSYGPEYTFFNNLASNVACMISSGQRPKRLHPDKARRNLQAIVDVRLKHFRKALEEQNEARSGVIEIEEDYPDNAPE
jgi:hypothetical protein